MSDFEARLEQLIKNPEQLSSLWGKVSSSIWRWLELRPQLRVEHLRAYVDAVGDGANLAALSPLAEQAHAEFEASLRSLERAQRAFGTVEPHLLNWAERILRVMRHADRVCDCYRANDVNRARATYQALQAVMPAALATLQPVDPSSFRQWTRIDSVESLTQAAHAERDFLGRRRGLLHAARELLMNSAADVADQAAVGRRLEGIGREIGELDRLEAMGVRRDVALTHQLRGALAQGKLSRVNGILTVMGSHALQNSDERVDELSRTALAQLWAGREQYSPGHRADSLAQSGRETFQEDLLAAVERGHKAARVALDAEMASLTEEFGIHSAREVQRHVDADGTSELIQAALYVDGCVDVGGVLSPHRVQETILEIREVRHPTAHLSLAPAEGVDDIKDALIHDPRTVLTDMATGRLLTRRYIGEQRSVRERRVMASEARIFLLDGSASMLGPRARMRDAILVAELSTLIARLNDPERCLTPTLYFRYFTKRLGDVCKVSTAAQAIAAVEQVLGALRFGGTDIEGALLGSFETLNEARQADSELARAQIVLITDGEAPVDEAAILAARAQVANVPIGVSIIALGIENPALRAFATHQREQGERVFYQHLDDALLKQLAEGKLGSLPLHLPNELAQVAPSQALIELIEEIDVVKRTRDTEALQRARDEQAARVEVGSADAELSKREEARILALSRDASRLEARFVQWFPKPAQADKGAQDTVPPLRVVVRPSDDDEAALEVVRALLAAVAELVELLGNEPLQRKVDAIELFERLLMERKLSYLRYRSLLDRHPAQLTDGLTRLWTAIEPGNGAA